MRELLVSEWFCVQYGLRLCAQYKMDRAQVMIYGAMGLYEEAVDAAIPLDLDMAKVPKFLYLSPSLFVRV